MIEEAFHVDNDILSDKNILNVKFSVFIWKIRLLHQETINKTLELRFSIT